MKGYLISLSVIAVASMSGCGPIDVSGFESLLSAQPKVVSISPASGAAVSDDAKVELTFSRQIDPSTVDVSTLAVLRLDDPEKSNDELAAKVEDGDTTGVSGTYEFNEEGDSVSFAADEKFTPGSAYLVVASSRIMSAEGLPLNQRAGMSPTPFASAFRVEGEAESAAAADVSGESSSGGGGGSDSGSGTESGAGGAADQRVRPTILVINELMYDAVGSDTDGDVFIELYGDAGGDISGYKVEFINGPDGKATETISLPDDSVIAADGIFLIADARTGVPGASDVAGADLIVNFDPQNGPDCVQVQNEKGEPLDAMGYGTPIIAVAENGRPCFEGAPAPTAASGQSLSRSGGIDSDDNSADFQVLTSPTPGVI